MASDSGTSLDLSSKEITEISDLSTFSSSVGIHSLHLAKNRLEYLPGDFFQILPNLKWLDLRDNLLRELPPSVGDHNNLQSILLANNCIARLPNELGKLTTLDYLQMKGNPLTYPDPSVMRGGTAQVLKFLKTELEKEEKNKEKPEESDTKEEEDNQICIDKRIGIIDSVKLDQMKKNQKLRSKKVVTKESVIESPQKDHLMAAKLACIDISLKVCPRAKTVKFTSSQRIRNYNSKKYTKPPQPPKKEEFLARIKRNKLHNSTKTIHRQLLDFRERVLQNSKTIEELKTWRELYKCNKTMGKFKNMSKIQPPYSTDPGYDRILNRKDLFDDLPDKYKRQLNTKIRAICSGKSSKHEVSKEIVDIFNALEGVNFKEPPQTPKSEQQKISKEIIKLTDIMKRLDSLRLENDGTV